MHKRAALRIDYVPEQIGGLIERRRDFSQLVARRLHEFSFTFGAGFVKTRARSEFGSFRALEVFSCRNHFPRLGSISATTGANLPPS
jgi:hypothetical protein